MIRNIYYYIIAYKGLHPIRFWIFIIVLILLFALLAFSINILNQKNRNKDKLVENIRNQEDQNTTNDEAKNVKSPNFLQKYKVLIGLFIFLMLTIGLILAVVPNTGSEPNRTENLSISRSEYIFGIDISHYQGRIDWSEMRNSHHTIEYIFIRATMGINGSDKRFKKNWRKAKQHNYIRGAYHYYRPNQNSTQQFENYSDNVKLISGDFIPILDVEKQGRFGKKNLREGVLNWLKLAENEYGVKPMIYTGLTFYEHNLKGFVDDYPLWIAAYSGKHRLTKVNWTFHQFTEKVSVKGIRTLVDGNDFNGELNDLKKYCL